MPIHAYDYIFAVGTIFAFLDAFNIGANDVANSFATSVASRSLTLLQAMMIATVMEFGGAMGVGARVADTIRTKIVSPKLYEEDPAVLMLGMCCAVIGSSIYLTMATRLGMPVSTTHSIMGGVIGMAVATVGWDKVSWGWSGVAQVFAAWGIAPALAGGFGAVIFLITKYGVMKASQPVKRAFFTVPLYFILTSALLTMLIVWKGASSRIKLTEAETTGVIVSVGFGVGAIVTIFGLPYLWRKLIKDDWELKWYHIFMGPLLLKRGEVPPMPEDHEIVKDYYAGYKHEDEAARPKGNDAEHDADLKQANIDESSARDSNDEKPVSRRFQKVHKPIVGPRPEGVWYSMPVIFWALKKGFFHGVDQDVASAQAEKSALSGDVDDLHAHAAHYDNKAEHMYSFLQIMTAATASFAHGANDVSNAIGPYATIFDIWESGQIKSKSPVPVWILAFGGASIVIGLWCYGYNIMKNLGNRITLHSPSRGFSMELGAAITVILATKQSLPVSTTQCITGATVGVGLCSGTWRTINWRMVGFIYFGWFITLPVTAIISGCLMGFIINAPQWGNSISL